MRAVILTIDTQIYQGFKEDLNAAVMKRMLEQVGFTIEMQKAIPKDKDVVKPILARIVDEGNTDFIVTLDGIGCFPGDTVPEATKEVLDREIPGIAEAVRTFCIRTDKKALLMRGVAGIRKNTLIMNLPASPKVNKEILEYILPELVLTVEILLGQHTKGE